MFAKKNKNVLDVKCEVSPFGATADPEAVRFLPSTKLSLRALSTSSWVMIVVRRPSGVELMESLKLGNVLDFVQLIHRPMMAKN